MVPMRRDPRTGELSYTLEAMRTFDRLRGLLKDLTREPTGGQIRRLRETLGMTQIAFGNELKVTSQTVSRWERGEVKPSGDTMVRLRCLQSRALRDGLAIPDPPAGNGRRERHASTTSPPRDPLQETERSIRN